MQHSKSTLCYRARCPYQPDPGPGGKWESIPLTYLGAINCREARKRAQRWQIGAESSWEKIMRTRHFIGLVLAAAIGLPFAFEAEAQENLMQEKTDPLILTAQIPLPGVHGRFDHFAFDPKEPGRI